MTIAIVGPTATGKSRFALRAAQAVDGEIVSVDSGAVYREMDIGTAKPSAAARRRVRHHLVDICEPCDTYNVGRFYADAHAAINDIRARGKTPLLVGGSMMYFNALVCGIANIPAVPAAVRRCVEGEVNTRGLGALYEELQAVDAAAAAAIKPNDVQRITRALSVFCATRRPLSFWQQQKPAANNTPPLRTILFLPQKRETLRQCIARRLEQMWASGLLEETRYILNRWQLAATAAPLRMAGYRQAVAHVQGRLSHRDMRQRAYYASCQLAKRQLTWMNKWQTAATLIDPFAFDEQALIATLTNASASTHPPLLRL